MVSVRITRSVQVPDPVRLARLRKVPELGPRPLTFGGGTALRETSRRLIEYTHNSIHLITPFDSGGSSAKLRTAFRMPAVGDLRNRLMALADRSVHGQPEIVELFSFRFPADADAQQLRRWLKRMIDGKDQRVRSIDAPMRRLICNHLGFFHERMPDDFDLRGASIGNLILAGGYLNQGRHLDPVIYLFSKLAEVRGVVRPISSADVRLAAELADGRTVVGQHQLTGKETAPPTSAIKRLFLTRDEREPEPYRLDLHEKVRDWVRRADAICYPPGSFYTSLIATLLPHGVGEAVASIDVPKLYIPNTGDDPEQRGLSLPQQVEILLSYLRASCDRRIETTDLLQYVLLDARSPAGDREQIKAVERMGPRVIELPLSEPETAPLLDAQRMAEALVSLA